MNEQLALVPWDFSEHSQAALDFARKRFADHAITIVCVLEPPNPYHPGFNWGAEAKAKSVENCRKTFCKQSGVTPESNMEFVVKFGDPAEQIVRVARDQSVAYVVMSTHGRTGFQRLMIGSVAQKVLASASCPVILLPNKWFEQEINDTEDQYKNKLVNELQKLP